MTTQPMVAGLLMLASTLVVLWAGCGDAGSSSSGSLSDTGVETDGSAIEDDSADTPTEDSASPPEDTVTPGPNLPPTVELLTPQGDVTLFIGEAREISFRIADDRDAPQDLTVVITSSLDGSLTFEGPSDQGIVSTTTSSLSEGVHTISASVADRDGASISGALTVTVEAYPAPELTFVTPAMDAVLLTNAGPVTIALEVRDMDDALGILTLGLTSDRDGVLGPLTPVEGTDNRVGVTTPLSVGAHTLTATATNMRGSTKTATLMVRVETDTPPRVDIVSPEEGATVMLGMDVDLSLTATDDRTPPNELRVELRSSLDGVIELGEVPNNMGQVTTVLSNLTPGTHLLTVSVTDNMDQRTEATRTLVVADPNAPSITIMAPADGAEVVVGEPLTLDIQLGNDGSEPLERIAVTVESSIDGVLAADGPDPTGRVTADLSVLSVGTHDLVVTASDTGGATASVSLRLMVVLDQAPTVRFIQPQNGATVGVGDLVMFQIEVSDDVDAPGELEVELTSSLDGMLGPLTGPDQAGIAQLTLPGLSLGQHTLTASATDSRNQTGTAILVFNVAQEIGTLNVVLAPPNPTTTDDVVATIEPSPPVGDLTWIWFIDNMASGFMGPTLDSSNTHRDQVWRVEATLVSDTTVYVGNATVTIANSAPSISGATVTPEQANRSESFTCAPMEWSDPDVDDPIMPIIQWFRLDDAQGVAIPGATGASLSASVLVPEDSVYCTLTPSDGDDQGTMRTSNLVTVVNRPPSIASTTIDVMGGGSADANSVLTCTAEGVTDPDGDNVTLAVTWTIGSTTVGTESTLLDGFSRDDTVTCTVTGTDIYN
ncbi:MAG: hypothetical protein AAFX99_23955, partial [Myxococcota bacterium]